MIAAIYARKSTEQNGVADEQKSVARQVEHARAYAARKSWIIADEHVYIDDGISGAEFANRPGFLRLMNSLKPRPNFQILIMSEVSRLGREQIETAYALKQLSVAGVRCFSYLEERELTMESATEKFLLSAVTFAADLEREKARQRTYDAMVRKAHAGHVTGGRVFGYDNVNMNSHVERRINESEATIVRRIFALCAEGLGVKRIAVTLNDEGAPSPRAQQGRPKGWAPSSVREVLYRPLYHGEIVWSRTKKRDTWGQKHPSERAEAEWIRRQAPHLRIVSEEAWTAAHRRLQAAQKTYLRGTKGQLWGRPPTCIETKYLLTGLARCAVCGGVLLVKTRPHGSRRVARYACSSYHRRGASICGNRLETPLKLANAALIDMLREDILHPDVVREAMAEALSALTTPTVPTDDGELVAELDRLKLELGRLTTALAEGDAMPAILSAIREREERRSVLERQRAARGQARTRAERVPAEIEEQLDQQMVNWRAMLGEETAWTRQILQKLLVDKVTFTPTTLPDGSPAYLIRARFHFDRLLSAIVTPSCPQGMASPRGFVNWGLESRNSQVPGARRLSSESLA
jgi:DNA invertase Pin-like site-specific DNA recombinase